MWKWLVGGLVAWIGLRLLAPEPVPTFDDEQHVPLELPGRTVFVHGIEFFIREDGPEDAPPLVLVHGWGDDTMAIFPRLIPLLSTDHRVIAVDNRNHGKTDHVRGRYDITTMADDLDGVLDRLGVRDATVFGFSMGGMIAQSLARRHPDRVGRLALSGTAADIPLLTDRLSPLARIGLTLVRAAERVTRTEVSWVRIRYLTHVGAVAPENARWYYSAHQNRDPDLYWLSADAMSRFDARPWIGDLDVPVMVIVTTRDQLMSPTWQWDLAARRPDAVVHRLDARHEAPLTHADELAAHLREFAAATPGADGSVDTDQAAAASEAAERSGGDTDEAAS
ncbi:alpha/beta fold hydrolase [Salsipaludibacter albus]|uniref:alpha/beta fold hydrolase n=1 Tax=Salsipaludibacter albus TaxID=2849650 RepID=UPI001EE493F6|nr:alpha/beta hydrolase [Salsipaludibacter albus]